MFVCGAGFGWAGCCRWGSFLLFGGLLALAYFAGKMPLRFNWSWITRSRLEVDIGLHYNVTSVLGASVSDNIDEAVFAKRCGFPFEAL